MIRFIVRRGNSPIVSSNSRLVGTVVLLKQEDSSLTIHSEKANRFSYLVHLLGDPRYQADQVQSIGSCICRKDQRCEGIGDQVLHLICEHQEHLCGDLWECRCPNQLFDLSLC